MTLSKKQNLRETIHGGNPDRLVNQFEYLGMWFDPIVMNCGCICDYGCEAHQTDWGYWVTWPEGIMGAFPMHDKDHLLLPDITQWDKVLKAPDPWAYTDEQWKEHDDFMANVDRNEVFAATQVFTGIFEKIHSFMGIDNACIALLDEPEAMHELIDFLVEWEIECAKVQIEHCHPEALFHHDDFGTQASLFMAPETLREFFVPAYSKLYGFWKDHGVELIIHHSDSFGQTIVPELIDMKIDIWQGVLDTNDIPAMIEQYGGRISFQGGLNNGKYDKEGVTREMIRDAVDNLIDGAGKHYIIPALTQGGPVSHYPGIYDMVTEEIDAKSARIF